MLQPLSPREREVIGLIAEGRTNKEIVHELPIAEGTLKNYVESIFRKLNVHSRAAAVAAWLQSGETDSRSA